MHQDAQTPARRHQWQKVFDAGQFNLFREKKTPTLYEVSWKRSNGSYGRRRFNAPSIEEALNEAPIVAGLITVQPTMDGQDLTVLEAFNEAFSHSKRGERARADWDGQQLRFMEWLTEHCPDCSEWRMITRRLIRDYMAKYNGRAPNTVRLAMQPIIQTAGYMSREYGLPHVAERLGIGSKLAKTPPNVYLADVAAFLDWIRVKHPLFEAGAALQGLVGLQLQEALRLTWDKVDLKRGLVEISGEVKNAYRNRVIPVCRKVVEILRRAHDARHGEKIIPVQEHVMLSPTGCSYVDGNSFRNYSRRLSKAFREWNAKVDWTPKDLRNCILTYAVTEGLHSEVWEQYVGHSPRTITARHYIPRLASATLGEKSALEKQMVSFRLHVVAPLDQAIKRIMGDQGSKILNIFERPAQNEAADVLVS